MLATIYVNFTTAFELLEDIVPTKEGDVIVLNAANSNVGQVITQAARGKGMRVVSVIRNRPNWAETEQLLKSCGAELVTTAEKLEEDLKGNSIPSPILGINAVGGESANALLKALAKGGVLVTFGVMTFDPISVSAVDLIFMNKKVVGYWMAGSQSKSAANKKAKIQEAIELVLKGGLSPPKTAVFDAATEWEAAFDKAAKGGSDAKVLLKFSDA